MTIEAAFDGRLGNAPQARTSASGKAWKSLSLAVSRGDNIEWVSIAAFDELAAILPPDLEKGERIYVEGKLKLSRWQKDGVDRVSLHVAASRIEVLDRIGRRPRRAGRKPVRRSSDEIGNSRERTTRMPNDP